MINIFIWELCYKHCTVFVETTYDIRTSFKTRSQKTTTWQLKNPQSNDKLL